MTKKLILSLGAITTVIGLGASVISCSDNTTKKYSIDTVKYESVSKTESSKKIQTRTETNTTPNNDSNTNDNVNKKTETTTNTLTPGLLNKLPIKDVTTQASLFDKKFSDISAADLQYDFDRALTDFYESYELETSNVEVEIENIKVVSAKYEKATDTTPAKISAKLEVRYEQETESNTRDDDKEEVKTSKINWSSELIFIDHGEIESIKAYIKNAVTQASSDGKNVDLSDLKEVFLGKQEDDFDKDDIGVFDQIQNLNNATGWSSKDMGSLVGYQINLSYIMDQILNKPATRANVVDGKTWFKVPSIKFNTYFKPSSQGEIIYNVATKTSDQQQAIINAAVAPITDAEVAKTILGVATAKELTDKNFTSLTINKLRNDKSTIFNFEFQVKYSKTNNTTQVTTETIDKFLVSFPKPNVTTFK